MDTDAVANRMQKLRTLIAHPETPAGERAAAQARLDAMLSRHGDVRPDRPFVGAGAPGTLDVEEFMRNVAEAMAKARGSGPSFDFQFGGKPFAAGGSFNPDAARRERARRDAERAARQQATVDRAAAAAKWLEDHIALDITMMRERVRGRTRWTVVEHIPGRGNVARDRLESDELIRFARLAGWRE